MMSSTDPATVQLGEQLGSSPPAIPAERHDLRTLRAIRRIIRAADLHSRRLASQHGITVPQLLCLTKLIENESLTVRELAAQIYVSASTVVGILDRLESRGLVTRRRGELDKRMVHVSITESGKKLVSDSPSPLHEELVAEMRAIPEEEQSEIANALEKLVDLLEIQRLDAAPILETNETLSQPEPNS